MTLQRLPKMSLLYILNKVKANTGWSDPDLTEEMRDLLVDRVNEAAQEIYDSLDLPEILREININVNSNNTIALPAFIGELRAIRNRRWDGQLKLRDIRPRYASKDWQTKWDGGRVIGESPIAIDIVNAGPLTIEYPIVDATLTITIQGETDNSNRAIDTIIMTTATKEGTKNYLDIRSIRKSKLTDYDLTISDADGNELALIYADQFDSRYMIMDISQYPNLVDCTDGTFVMEVLYKPRYPFMVNDSDEFPVMGYDNIITLRTEQLLAEKEDGKEKLALLMFQKSQLLLQNKIADKTNHIQKVLTPSRNPLLGMFRRSYYGSRRF